MISLSYGSTTISFDPENQTVKIFETAQQAELEVPFEDILVLAEILTNLKKNGHFQKQQETLRVRVER